MTSEYVVIKSDSTSMPNVQFAKLIAAVLSKGKSFRFQANGHSMSPFIRNGDIITISPISEKVKLGKVYAIFDSSQHLFIHRVVKINKEKFLLRGDNVLMFDGWFSQNEILGCITSVERQSNIIRLGLGFERILIAALSLYGWLMPLNMISRKFRYIIKKCHLG